MQDLQRLHSKFKVMRHALRHRAFLAHKDGMADRSTKVTWVPNEWVEKCINCSAEFSIFKWKNHCRLCGRSDALLCQSRSLPRLPTGTGRGVHASPPRPGALLALPLIANCADAVALHLAACPHSP